MVKSSVQPCSAEIFRKYNTNCRIGYFFAQSFFSKPTKKASFRLFFVVFFWGVVGLGGGA